MAVADGKINIPHIESTMISKRISAIILVCRERGAESMKKIYFISGIDTGIGKTVVTGLMARSLAARGVDAITVKMVQTGNDGFSEDLLSHRALAGESPRWMPLN